MADQARKNRFVEALTELSGSAGNGRLREALQWDEATYNAVKEDLVAEGAITQGRGGGSVFVGDVAGGRGSGDCGRGHPREACTCQRQRGNLGFEAELFKAADKLRGNMEPSDYKHSGKPMPMSCSSSALSPRRAATHREKCSRPRSRFSSKRTDAFTS